MRKVKFYKMHGLGNDYIYFDCISEKINIDEILPIIPQLSDRNFGIGSDGVVFLLPSDKADIRMRMFNSHDSSEAEMCGNAARCISKLAYDLSITSNSLTLETIPGIIEAKITQNAVKLKMFSLPDISDTSEQVNSEDKVFDFHRVNVGNPHAVIKVEKTDSFDVEKYGKPIEENTKLFPQKTNVEFYEEISKDVVKMRVWERGSGETLACGTGACAAAATHRLVNNNDINEITVQMRGGDLKLSWVDNNFYMQGEARFVYEGIIDLDNF